MIKFKYPNTKATEKQKKLLNNMVKLFTTYLLDIDKKLEIMDADIDSLTVKKASDLISDNMSMYIDYINIHYAEELTEEGRNFHEERGDV